MRCEEVAFHSGGVKLVGTLKLPDAPSEQPLPAIVEGPGWLAKSDNALSNKYHEGFVAGGYAVFTFDNRGFGKSGGEPGWVRPEEQVEDILSAVTVLHARPEVDPKRIGVFGFGGTGAGNAIYAAAFDPRIRCVAVMTVVADGPDWLHRMRREHEWVAFKRRVEANRLRRVLTGEDEMVDPRAELMVATPERKRAGMPTDDVLFHLSTAESLMRFRPLDVVGRIAPRGLLLACVEDDVVTPEDHAVALYERAGAPKRLVRQTGVTHYESYHHNYQALMDQFLGWYGQHLVSGSITVRSAEPTEEIVVLEHTAPGA